MLEVVVVGLLVPVVVVVIIVDSDHAGHSSVPAFDSLSLIVVVLDHLPYLINKDVDVGILSTAPDVK